MKLKQETAFRPVTIILETKQEVAELLDDLSGETHTGDSICTFLKRVYHDAQ